ncbi:platelet glycoprotein Ib alpha chain [Anabas testudineus]|uniref:platelet glycoprotein Ib alpha chain n=1 Tax=Anabas testudineus TaxID=64144 RepID=UPI000E458BEC|nr:platelet glycoprotein Ib alpha chain [Anabas testudineus]
MNRQLLLLLALVGPFCAFTHASPTSVPGEHNLTLSTGTGTYMTDEVTTTMTETSAAVTSRPPEPETSMTPQDITLEVFQETSTPSNTDAFERSTVTTGAPEPLTTTPPVVETDGPTDQSEQTMGPGVAEADLGGEVVVEDDTAEGLSSGQVAGIVIGALLAVVIVIAVVIAVVRRMGKYSP